MEGEGHNRLAAESTDASDSSSSSSDSDSSSDGVEVLGTRNPSPKHVAFAPLQQRREEEEGGGEGSDVNTSNNNNNINNVSKEKEGEEEDQWFPPKTSRKIAHKRQRDHTLTDQRSALEHITMIGNYHRHCNWRKNQWNWKRRRQQAPVEEPEEEQQAAAAAAAAGPSTQHFVHAEDVRIYGTRQSPAAPWPNSLSTVVSDAPWDREHGDGISSLHFAQTHLSSAAAADPPLPLPQHQQTNQPMAACSETETLLQASHALDSRRQPETLDAASVPRAMVLRCWQRAMDAASFSTLQQQPCVNNHLNNNNDNQQLTQSTLPSQKLALLEQQKSAKDRCRDLPVDLSSMEQKDDTEQQQQQQSFQCSICGLVCDSHDQLLDHVYGSSQQHQVACSWTRIPVKQRSIISETLQQEVKAQARTLIHLVFTKTKQRLMEQQQTDDSKQGSNNNPKGNNNNTTSKRRRNKDNAAADPQQPESGSLPKEEDILDDNKKLVNWMDVVEMLQESLSSSTGATMTTMPLSNILHNNNDHQTGAPYVTDTLDVRKSLAPLVLNQQVLDAVSHRLTQRYANVQY